MMPLAFRNLWRRKRRTLITAGSIGFGLWLSVLTVGTRESTYQRLMKTSALGGFGYLTIAGDAFHPAHPQLSALTLTPASIKIWQQHPDLSHVTPRRVGEAVASSTTQSTGVGWMAIDPERESAETNIYCQTLIEGRCESSWTAGAMIGQVLAQRLKLRLQDSFVYTLQDDAGQSLSLMTHVQGIFRTGSDELDGHFFVLPFAELQSGSQAAINKISFYALYLRDAHAVDRVLEEIGSQLTPGLKLFTWRQTQADLASFFAADQLMYYAMLLFVGLIIASGVGTCMILNVTERRKEIGTMLALGMLPRQVLGLLLTEALWLSGLGLILGTLAVAPFYFYLNRYGIDLSSLIGGSWNVGGVAQRELVLHCSLQLRQGLAIVFALLGSSLLAGFLPSLKAAYALPAQILHGN